MASERMVMILKSRGAPFSPEKLEQMNDEECWEWLYTTFPPEPRDIREQISSTGQLDDEKERHLRDLAARAGHNPAAKIVKQLKTLFMGENKELAAFMENLRALMGRISFRRPARKTLDTWAVKEKVENLTLAVQEELPVTNPPRKVSSWNLLSMKNDSPFLRRLPYCLFGLAGVGLIIFAGRLYLRAPEEIATPSFRFGHSLLDERSDLSLRDKNSDPLPKPAETSTLTLPPPQESGKSNLEVSPPANEIDKKPLILKVAASPAAAAPSSRPAHHPPPMEGKREMTVKAGDSIYTIARKAYHVANTSVVDRILESNAGLSKSDHLTAGQKIHIPEISEESLLISSSKGTCKVRLGTFLKPEYSSFLKDQAGLKGKKIEILPHRLPSGQTWYRIVAGPFPSREQGLKMIHSLRERGLSPYFQEFKRPS